MRERFVRGCSDWLPRWAAEDLEQQLHAGHIDMSMMRETIHDQHCLLALANAIARKPIGGAMPTHPLLIQLRWVPKRVFHTRSDLL